jgi:hypothetical protein
VTIVGSKPSGAGACSPSCASPPSDHLERIDRFDDPWEAAASLRVRNSKPRALDAYQAHHRTIGGTLATTWTRSSRPGLDYHADGTALAITATTNDHVALIKKAIRRERLACGGS